MMQPIIVIGELPYERLQNDLKKVVREIQEGKPTEARLAELRRQRDQLELQFAELARQGQLPPPSAPAG